MHGTSVTLNELQKKYQKMIQVKNLQIHRDIPFEKYLLMPGLSHSTIRNDGKDIKPATPKMQLGIFIHQYLNEPDQYKYDNIEIVKPAAQALKNTIGVLFQWLEPELSITADFIFQGMVLNYKGRIDGAILKKLVVDYKASSMPLERSIPFFGYDNSMSGYAIAIDAKAAIIVRVDPASCKPGKRPLTQVYNAAIKQDWWQYQILKYGKPL